LAQEIWVTLDVGTSSAPVSTIPIGTIGVIELLQNRIENGSAVCL